MNLIVNPRIINTYNWPVWWAGDSICLDYISFSWFFMWMSGERRVYIELYE